jgi:F-type H+-transporting ATPase subunit epsilon
MASSSILTVEVVSPEKRLWSGEASAVSARTLEGDIGILVDHAPLLGVLVPGVVTIKNADGTKTDFDMAGGFISVNKNRVSILGEESE